MSPQPDAGTNPVLAIARADCPPDCGGGPGNGGMPSGPPEGGTEFVPPSIPAMPSYDPGQGQPPLDQNNGISIYNSNTPQPSQAAQPSQAPSQNQDGSYNRAANGEQQPINHNAPDNQQLNQDWQKLSDQLNQQQGQSGQQSGQENGQNNNLDDRCTAAWESVADQLAQVASGATHVLGESSEQARLADGAASQFDQILNAAMIQHGVTPQQCGGTKASGDPNNGANSNNGDANQHREDPCNDKQSPINAIQRMLDEARVDKSQEIENLQQKADSLRSMLANDPAGPNPGGDPEKTQEYRRQIASTELSIRNAVKDYYELPDYSGTQDVRYTIPSGNPDKGDPLFNSPSVPPGQPWWVIEMSYSQPSGPKPAPNSEPAIEVITQPGGGYIVNDFWTNIQTVLSNGKLVKSGPIPPYGTAPGAAAEQVNSYVGRALWESAWFLINPPSAPERATAEAIMEWLIKDKSPEINWDGMKDVLEKLLFEEKKEGEKHTETPGDLLANTIHKSADAAKQRLAQRVSSCH
ncbi:hypothetical protein [Mycobacteroides abscessus]|uniref:hypothetical protein n=1 Tax=Mycobacteroides abscessus TaxID=36809 RepID=UPI001F41960A|nr:hypothetical protein [Mycobacteroides abscessus]